MNVRRFRSAVEQAQLDLKWLREEHDKGKVSDKDFARRVQRIVDNLQIELIETQGPN